MVEIIVVLYSQKQRKELNMSKGIYINGILSIAPVPCFENGFFDSELDLSPKRFLKIIKPPYSDYIPGKKLRRMTKIIRLGLIGSQKALADAKISTVDSIVFATGNGNISDTQKFLNAILDNDEKMLVPTSFVQSTNNIVAGSIAMMLKSKGYNMTYTHHSTSFEMGLLDAIMQFEEQEAEQILVGAVDEITEENIQIRNQCDLWVKEQINPFDIFKGAGQNHAMIGESSSIFVLSNNVQENSYAKLLDVDLFYHFDKQSIENHIQAFLAKNELTSQDIDLVFGGFNGVEKYDQEQYNLITKLFPSSEIAAYKQFVGEHPTASAFALWMAAQILSGKEIPKEIYYSKNTNRTQEIKHILIIQKAYLSEEDYGLILLRKI